MSNLLKQAINFDDGDRAVKIIQDARHPIRRRSSITVSQRHGQPTASSAPALSASSCRRRCGFSPHDALHEFFDFVLILVTAGALGILLTPLLYITLQSVRCRN